MKLLFDIGNSRMKWAFSSKGEVASSADLAGAIEVEKVDQAFLHDTFAQKAQHDSVWVSNVGSKEVVELLRDWFDSELSMTINVLSVSTHCCDIKNNYQTQQSLGVDRWLAAVGARAVVAEGDVIIVDVGTAVTIDWLSADNQYQGGAILPGFHLMHDSLMERTAAIKSGYQSTSYQARRQIIGTTTQECVNSGVTYGLVGAIEMIIKQMQKTIDRPTTCLLTGGGASQVLSLCSVELLLQPSLVLLGVESAASQEL